MNQELAPIVLFVYNRPNHTSLALESLRQNFGVEDFRLIVFCDGPKEDASEEDLHKIKQVRDMVQEINWTNELQVITSDKNKGLANSVIQGVSFVIEKYGSVIVLEDDLILSPYFLRYMQANLIRFEKYPEVMHISGYVPPMKVDKQQLMLKGGTSTWGWATWRESWMNFESDANVLIDKIKSSNIVHLFNLHDSYDYMRMLVECAEGKNSSWGIRWYASVFLKDGYGIWPGVSYVGNIGHDNSGTHCTETTAYDHAYLAKDVLKRDFPVIADDTFARKSLIAFHKHLTGRSIKQRIRRRILNTAKKIGAKF